MIHTCGGPTFRSWDLLQSLNPNLEGNRYDYYRMTNIACPIVMTLEATNFIAVAREDEVPEGSMFGVAVSGKPILLSKIGGKIYAMDAVCSHMNGYLPKGELRDHGSNLPGSQGTV
jgi:hypothetical protein